MHKILGECGAENVLVSFYYLREKGTKTIETILKKFPYVFLDSGAFTLRLRLAKEGIDPSSSYANDEIDLYIDDYAEFVNAYGEHFALVTEVDVGSWQQKTRYRAQLLDKLKGNVTLLPVVHRADPIRYVDFLCSKYPYIAYAGLKKHSIAENKKYLAQRLHWAKKHGKPIHGFALTVVEIMKSLGMASVDSASWLHGGKHGMTFYFDGRDLRSYDKFNKWIRLRFKNEVKGLGISWDDFMDDKPSAINAFNLIQWLKFQNYLNDETKGLGKLKKKQEEFWNGKG